MPDDPKTDPPNTDPPNTDPPKGDPPKSDPPSNDPPKGDPPKDDGDEKLRQLVREELQKLRAGNPGGLRVDLEEQARRMVEEASERLKARQAEEERINNIETKVKEITEVAPAKVRRLTKAFWGDPGKADQK